MNISLFLKGDNTSRNKVCKIFLLYTVIAIYLLIHMTSMKTKKSLTTEYVH